MTTSAAPCARVLTVRDLRKSFRMHHLGGREVVALRGIDLHVDAGEHVAVAGSSGAGKSTLLKSIYRTYLPTGGEVVLRTQDREVDLVRLPDSELVRLRNREIGYVSQFLRAEPRRTSLEVVTRAGVRRGLGREEAREAAAEALGRLNLREELWHTYPTLLSGGEKQRVNLASATIAPPRLLLLDEPVSALDPANREAVVSFVASLADGGAAVLAVFHDVDLMQRLATRVVLIDEGVVAHEGSPDEVFASA